MFERYLASYLNSFLGEYVEEGCFSKEKLTIGAWDGSIVLTDLKLKASALDVLNLPITLKKGIIGRLKLEVRVWRRSAWRVFTFGWRWWGRLFRDVDMCLGNDSLCLPALSQPPHYPPDTLAI